MIGKTKYFLIPCISLITACAGRGSSASETAARQQVHWAEVNNPALGSLYADEVDPTRIMQTIDSGSTKFVAYKIGLREDRSADDKRYVLDRGKYLQYDMQRDWSLKAKADSFSAVHFQPVVKKIAQVDEGILIFEIPAGTTPDTLIYHDSFGGWGIQKMILNGH